MFDPIRALKVLDSHGVRFVLIGGFAGRFWGSNTITNDLDICHARDDRNLKALAKALNDLEARLRGAPEDIPFLLDDRTLRAGDHFTFATSAGNLDCLGNPPGSRGYLDLIQAATEMVVDSVRIPVASLDDLIRLKRAAGRPKDLVEIEILGALRDEIESSRRENPKSKRQP
jgi:hypothetical protein